MDGELVILFCEIKITCNKTLILKRNRVKYHLIVMSWVLKICRIISLLFVTYFVYPGTDFSFLFFLFYIWNVIGFQVALKRYLCYGLCRKQMLYFFKIRSDISNETWFCKASKHWRHLSFITREQQGLDTRHLGYF